MPSNLAITKVGAPTWLGLLIFCWGIIAASTAAMKNKGTFYAREAPRFPKKNDSHIMIRPPHCLLEQTAASTAAMKSNKGTFYARKAPLFLYTAGIL